ncbi:mechanosensitive ion channel [Flavobacterium sp. NST-5]|uniref:Mechanosensitive ion channel n=1 Tax=Flavobacterium ichthyis TaxID=2698827 RepID=A0ABW9Z651_9FLAO|nr:mechanosensitive ion channel domain-containing protein [Flavobacterium ichthyis]NBL64323.1 mechanosensitive ion channel [Flavobacterium ichthyis]
MSFKEFLPEIITTVLLIVAVMLIRALITNVIKKFSKRTELNENRATLITKYINIVITILMVGAITIIWGVKTEDLYIAFTTVITLIGVAFFAQWSILSNITAGIILFFAFPFKIGDTIKVHDKDFPLEAEIEDIKTFHIILRTLDGEIIVYPNNLLLQKGISILKVTQDEREFHD